MRNRVEVFLEDMTYNTRFEFLEEGKDKEELMEIYLLKNELTNPVFTQ